MYIWEEAISMKYKDKQILFSQFLDKWALSFNQIPFIYEYIMSYPELSDLFREYKFSFQRDFNEEQLEWGSLISQFTHPDDVKFFKPNWFPLQHDDYDYFLEFSTNGFSMFMLKFIFEEPYGWYKMYLFKDITDFLASVDNPQIDIYDILNSNKDEWIIKEKTLYKT